jgi:hypothetical protein
MRKKKKLTVVHLGERCSVKFTAYQNGRTAIVLYDASGEEWTTATVNLPGAELAPDEVLVKDYSENVGMLQALVEAGIVEPTGRTVRSGFVEIPVARLREGRGVAAEEPPKGEVT